MNHNETLFYGLLLMAITYKVCLFICIFILYYFDEAYFDFYLSVVNKVINLFIYRKHRICFTTIF